MQYFYTFFVFPIVIFNLIFTVITVNISSDRLVTSGSAVEGISIMASWLISALVFGT